MYYNCGILRTDVSDEAICHNDKLLGLHTLGIEVTDESFANRCGLGNIDPQHQVRGKSSAIEEALSFPLPKEGSKLVTMRPDKDSIGAMAVLTLRALDMGDQIDKLLVLWIGAMDRYGYINAAHNNPDLADHFLKSLETDALNTICLNPRLWRTLSDRVSLVGRILIGNMSGEEMMAVIQLRSRQTKKFLAQIVNDVPFIAVHGDFDKARDWANKRYPVALVYDDCHLSHGGSIRKFSLIRQPLFFDRIGFEKAINAIEAQAREMTPKEL